VNGCLFETSTTGGSSARQGVKLGVAEAGIRKAGRTDLLLMTLAEGARVAGVFTQNRFCAAPVQVAKEHLASGGLPGGCSSTPATPTPVPEIPASPAQGRAARKQRG